MRQTLFRSGFYFARVSAIMEKNGPSRHIHTAEATALKRFFGKHGIIICVIIIIAIILADCYALYSDLAGEVFSDGGCGEVNIILDPGHGGEDGGAVTLTGRTEQELNLSIAQKTEQILALFGTSCILTRESGSVEYPDSAKTTRARKSADTKARVELANSTPNAVFISIHQNKFGTDTQAHGAQVFFAPTEKSEELAKRLSDALTGAIGSENVRAQTQISKNIYIMNHIKCPAALVECGFVSNRRECEKLESDGYQTVLAGSIASGIAQFAGDLNGGGNET